MVEESFFTSYFKFIKIINVEPFLLRRRPESPNFNLSHWYIFTYWAKLFFVSDCQPL